ncbi:MAG: PEP-CTERM sorting domain-containing protein [Candidatus Electrothrix sp. GM3_4]|nr:PEP-CTERM sorting domain-containing protein [Candidatus Electrothrix sp. GM3_4]
MLIFYIQNMVLSDTKYSTVLHTSSIKCSSENCSHLLTHDQGELIVKNLAKKSLVPAFASALLILAAGQAQAVLSINITAGGGTGPGVMLEDFEDVAAGWYQNLATDVGTFTAVGAPGTGGTSYNAVDPYGTGPSTDPWFQIRDFDDNGRFNTTDPGEKYLDSADITGLSLNLNPGYDYISFLITDPGDVQGITTLGGHTNFSDLFAGIMPPLDNGSIFRVEISDNEFALTGLTFAVNNTHDGFGVDDFTTAVPEPATALLLGAGLLPLMGFLRRKKEDEM